MLKVQENKEKKRKVSYACSILPRSKISLRKNKTINAEYNMIYNVQGKS